MDDGSYYMEGGNIQKIEISIYVKNIEIASEFYRESLHLEEESKGIFKISNDLCKLKLIEGESINKNIGITLITDSVFSFHRKLVDEGVEIISKPKKNESGVVEATFADIDGNMFRILEID